jgi:hypothetical protein
MWRVNRQGSAERTREQSVTGLLGSVWIGVQSYDTGDFRFGNLAATLHEKAADTQAKPLPVDFRTHFRI